jgi:cyclic dehypoxanthinyl futalosine synthase
MGISRKVALVCFASDDLIGIGMEADAVRRSLHPEGVVSYTLDGRIDYTDCADGAGFEVIAGKVAEIESMGGSAVTLQGEPGPHHTLAWFEGLFRGLKQRFPSLWLHCLSAGEILAISRGSNASLHDTIALLRDSGLDSISGSDAGVLDDAVQHQHGHRSTEDWVAVHRAAHRLGMQTTATMTFGMGETTEHRIHHLETLRRLQEETGGFCSFTPLAFTPVSAATPGFEEATAVEYLKTLAISRMYLDNILNVQSNLETQGLKVLQVGLRFGANDAGNVLHADGANAATEEQLRQVIRDAGFKPVQRDSAYRTMFLN